MKRLLGFYAVFVIAMACLGFVQVAPWFGAFVIGLGVLHVVFPLLLWWRS